MGLFSDIAGAFDDFGLDDLVTGVGAVKTVVDLFDDDEVKVPANVQRAGEDVSAIARALMDPTDPLFVNLAAEEEGIIARDYARALKDIGVANRRMMARTGGMGILDPERRDEALASAYTKSYADRKQMARDQARAYLSSALQANQAVAGAYAPMIAADQAQREREASGMQMLLDLAGTFTKPTSDISLDVRNLMNPPGLSFSTRPAVSTYTTPGFV